ncbi:hypothetical protein ACJMK2_043560 [Sinanodonta woodiana]|uniref:Uncharacterized protein n=1 Tax=Sinanodonta woodiana TaxID=1069815 RepID=A0ABD3W0V6_SINWO
MSKTICFAGAGKLRKVALSYCQDVILNLYNVKIKMDSRIIKFKSERELPVITALDLNSAKCQLCQSLQSIFPDIADDSYKKFEEICTWILEHKCVKDLIADIEAVSINAVRTIKEWGLVKENYIGVVPTDNGHESLFEVNVDTDLNRIYLHWEISKLSENFLVAVSRLAQTLRDEGRQPTSVEYLAFQFAYYHLSNGESLTHEHARCLGTPGFRPHTQTYMSLTDPGEGHVFGTSRFNEWMKGAIIHVEHLERPRNLPRENIESYRVPSILDFAKVRLHVGPAAPTTYFVGRRIKDSGNFDEDYIKLVNITAAAATAAFFQGAAECKVSMEGMTTLQAVRYMHSLRAQVQRKKKQFLSAAWNLNQTIIDDYDRIEPIELTQRMEIATRAIEITSIGGFNKVTWDGASDTYPSTCIMYQLNFEEALTIVHETHQRGLVTYFSAGFKFNEIKYAVFTGVDGIGIGGAQVLRFMDGETGMHGPYTEENISRILASRDEAARSFRGRGVHLLARLDTMFFEGSISKRHNRLRKYLFDALLAIDEKRIASLIQELDAVVYLTEEGNEPLLGTAKRFLSTEEPMLKKYCESENEWKTFTKMLKSLVISKDTASLYEEYDSDPWLSMRKAYRQKQLGKNNIISRQNSFHVTCRSVRL